jgi:hypothetical protein
MCPKISFQSITPTQNSEEPLKDMQNQLIRKIRRAVEAPKEMVSSEAPFEFEFKVIYEFEFEE